MTDSIKLYLKDSPEYKKLQRAAVKLTDASPRRRKYFVGETYYDLRQSWVWTTILCESQYGAYQALSPVTQSMIVTAETDIQIDKAVHEVLSDPHCPDKKSV